MLRWILAGAFALAFLVPAQAHDYKAGDITIDHPWARATAASQANGAAYMTLDNHGAADRLVGAESIAADRIELHTHIDDKGVMRMRQLDAIDLPAGQITELEPGGLHLMMLELDSPLTEGETFPLILTFEKAGRIEVEVQVEPVTYGIGGKKDHGMDHEGHGSGN